ncbi:MAG: hypothetical protein QOI10_93 [Solirubrobacterales bacterium]|jgi:hypothetical protein|nr:hypothetical protein [Solirubrobacterales bacterium]
MARALNRPIRIWHAILAIAAIGVVAAAGSALAGGSHDNSDRIALQSGQALKASGYHYVGKVVNNAAGTQSTIVEACPHGTVPIAGGGGGASETAGEQALVYSNLADGPDANSKPDSWLVAVDNTSSKDLNASVEAICVDR